MEVLITVVPFWKLFEEWFCSEEYDYGPTGSGTVSYFKQRWINGHGNGKSLETYRVEDIKAIFGRRVKVKEKRNNDSNPIVFNGYTYALR